MKKISLVFIGSGVLGIDILKLLLKKENINLNHIITKKPAPAGRGRKLTKTAIGEYCHSNNIDYQEVESINTDGFDLLKKQPLDAAIIVEFGQFVKKEVFDYPEYGFINIHPSLLPQYRGASPIRYSLLNGDKVTGITAIKLVEKMDAGPIIKQKKLLIEEKDDYRTLKLRLSKLAAEVINDVSEEIEQNKLCLLDQDENKASFANKLRSADLYINWQKQSRQICNQIRALSPYPGTRTFINNKILKIYEADIFNEEHLIEEEIEIGHIKIINQKKIIVKAIDNKYIELKRIKLEGGKLLTAREFILGHSRILEKHEIGKGQCSL